MTRANDAASLFDAVVAGRESSVGSGRPEAVLREAVQPALSAALAAAGVRSRAADEAPLQVPAPNLAGELDAPLTSLGRADAIYNRFVIEFEPPGSMRASLMHSATRHAINQVKQYLRGVSDRDGLPLERLAGCAFDGYWISYVSWERGDWSETRPRPIDAEALLDLVTTLASLASGRGLTAENLEDDFGRNSDCAQMILPALFAGVQSGSSHADAMFKQWSYDLGISAGPLSYSDSDDWEKLCDELGMPSEVDVASAVLFALQTYFSMIAKLVALVILEGATGHKLVRSLSDFQDVFTAFRELEQGHLTEVTGAMNVIEPNVFSWYVHESESNDLGTGLRFASERLAEYSAEIVEVSPSTVRDVLKDVYQRLLPGSIRHRLGEYYTPDWLAGRLVDQLLAVPTPTHASSESRIVDPACGSGTFLVEIINRLMATAANDDKRQVLENVLRNVVGFDISPMAVQAAKVNYLLALAPALRSASEPFWIPIYLADAVSPPRRGDLFEGDVYVFQSSEGEWYLPSSVVEGGELGKLGELVLIAIDEGWSVEDFRTSCEQRLGAYVRDEQVLAAVVELYSKLDDLNVRGRDGIWWQVITNAFAPVMQGVFDFVVGNPPWVSWETLPEAYRRANDTQWLRYGLRPDAPLDRRQASSNVLLDLSMLFVARAMDRLLRDGGRLGFVITSSVFKSEMAGRGFRRFGLQSGRYKLCLIEDMSRVNAFEGASNQTSLMVASKEDESSYPIPVVAWSAPSGGTVTISGKLDLVAVSERTRRRRLVAEPVSRLDEASPLIYLPEEAIEISRPLRLPSPYAERVRNGIHTRGANGFFFLQVIESRDGLVLVENVVSAGRNPDFLQRQAWVEEGAVKALLRGEDVQRGVAQPKLGLLFFHDEENLSHPVAEATAARRWPLAYKFAKQSERALRARRKFRNFDPAGAHWLGMYSVTRSAVARHKVVFREIANGIICAPVTGEDVVPDHKLYVISCSSEDEASWLSDVMSSPLVDGLSRAFAVNTSIGGSLLRYIGIRDLRGRELPASPRRRVEVALGLEGRELRILEEAMGLDAI